MPLEAAAQGIGLLAHAATTVLVYLGARRLYGAPPALALVPAAFLAVGPGLRHLAACYGTPLFVLLATLAFWAAARVAQAEPQAVGRSSLVFALLALTMGLARPEGVFLGVFLLAAIALERRGGESGVVIGRFAFVFLTLGLAYFLWRWHYFGHPLPNPFYKKGGGLLHFFSLRMAWRNLWALSLPFTVLLVAGLLIRSTRRAAVFTLLPTLAFVGLWVLISDETNYVMRFRYPVLPMVLLGSVAVTMALRPAWSRLTRPAVAWVLSLAVAGSLAAYQHSRFRSVATKRMGLYDAALVLREVGRRDYTLATTEAGLLPLYSSWRAVDAWGLNDAWIAHNGGITEEYLERYRPEVILFHAYFSPETPDTGPKVEARSLGLPWYRMVMTLKRYAEKNDYALAAVYGRNAWDTHYYYVRRGFADSQVLVDRLRSLDYAWDDEPTANFTPE